MDTLLTGYIEDLKDYIITFNEALIRLENDFQDKEVINIIFRVAHTIKGNSAAMQFLKIKQIMHTMEDILHEVREGKRPMDEVLAGILFSCHDFLEDCLVYITRDGNDDNLEEIDLLNELNRIKDGLTDGNEKQCQQDMDTNALNSDKKDKTLELPFILTDDTLELICENLNRGMNLLYITIKIKDDTLMKSIRNIILLNTVEENGILLLSNPPKPEQDKMLEEQFIYDHINSEMLVLSEKDQECWLEILKLEPEVDAFTCQEITAIKLNEIYSYQQSIHQNMNDELEIFDTVNNAKMEFPIIETKSQISFDVNNVTGDKTNQSMEHMAIKKQDTKENALKPNETTEFIRISTQKVDSIVEMLGELIIFNSQLEQYAYQELSSTDKTMNILPKMSKLIKNIQDLSMTLRMVPIKPILHKLTRIARDTSAELGKKITVVLDGENTEIDKSASEKIFDPLMHIIRNAVAHGIENEEVRSGRGKKVEGTIRISAYHKRNHVCIEISDDGGGMDANKIYKKAMEKNFIDETKNYTEDEIIRMIFKPGFSTQEKIDGVSGRGVGMNVVESEVTKLRGKIEIENEVGQGCKFIIKIPMNLAVLNGTIIELEGNRFIIPTLFIKEFFIIKNQNWISMQGIKKGIRVRDSIIPIIAADEILNEKTNQNLDLIREMVILELEQRYIAIPVDKIIGRQEVVAKPLNEMFHGTEIFSGASILGDGKVTMILDVDALFKLV